jgi:thiamine monophosphate synthase
MASYVASGPSTARPEPFDSRLAQDRLVEGRALRAGVNRTTDGRQAPADFLVGRSVHLLAEAVEHAPAVDYLIAGTVFPTVSKPAAARLLGQSGLSQMAASVRVPILGIGGVTVEQVPAIAASGAAGVAGIGMFLPSAISMRTLAAEVRAQFDRVGTTFTTGC